MSGKIAAFHDFEPIQDDFRSAVLDGLSSPQKSIPSKFFYDEEGSALFDRICHLEEYYPTRTELGILQKHGKEIASFTGEHTHLIEFGSGSSTKIQTLLDAINKPLSYIPMDISKEHLLEAAKNLAARFPEIPVIAICADYTSDFQFPALVPGKRTGFFPGSTIGNFAPNEATDFLRQTRQILNGGDLLIGVDLVKDHDVLFQAYNDQEGITAQFNLNILARCNAELSANFVIDNFEHYAPYNEKQSRIEMHLVSKTNQIVSVGENTFSFKAGESIHTENSYKYTIEGFQKLASVAGYKSGKAWIDEQSLFSVHFLSSSEVPL
ncbi:L-histidine N(alpha)-methyltransferase [Sneathiella sp.]|jgi:dimethylhistidine N-methyltransferase|uniref:L-histidine N(alpha)-methyltransferase n=1 Tax=Sneathiella sp. TaxID=1964365 RepID=UPI0039E3195E